MRRTQHVSLWGTPLASEAALEKSLLVAYDDDGDQIAPAFAKAFGFERFNEATCEAEVLEKPTGDIAKALEGFSYDSQITPKFVAVLGTLSEEIAAVVLLYHFEFSGKPLSASVGGVRWKFLGSATYVV